MMNHKTISNGFQEAHTQKRLSQRYPSPWEFLFNFNPFDNSEIISLQMTALKLVFFPTLQYETVGGASSKAGVLKRNLLAGLRGAEISLLEIAKGERKVMSGHNLSPQNLRLMTLARKAEELGLNGKSRKTLETPKFLDLKSSTCIIILKCLCRSYPDIKFTQYLASIYWDWKKQKHLEPC